MKVSVIIPTYNEEKVIGECLVSLSRQSYKDLEIILVDDGSTDQTISKIKEQKAKIQSKNLKILTEQHKGAGSARNLGAKHAKGEILVFVDADMTFHKDFIKKLVEPILLGATIGTYSTNEKLLNKNEPWAVCWNLNFSGSEEKVTRTSKETPITKLYHLVKRVLESLEMIIAPISHKTITPLTVGGSNLPYRAILKSTFNSVGGFTTTPGYTDDWTLAQKLHKLPSAVSTEYYHRSPSSINEIWKQSRWIGKDELKTGNIVRQIKSLIVDNPVSSLISGTFGAIRYRNPRFLVFKLIFGIAITKSVLESFFNKSRAK